jgi:glycosyltransferase involved in cell wall biosynthesis
MKLKVLFDAGGLWQFVPFRFRTIMERRFDCVFLENRTDQKAMGEELGEWSDVIFIDWALDWAAYYLEHFPTKRIIIRTHWADVWYEKSPFYYWENVDAVLFMNNVQRKRFLRESKKHILEDLTNRCYTVPRLVDETFFRVPNRTTFSNRIGMLGRFKPVKGGLEIASLMDNELRDFSLSLKGVTEGDYKFFPNNVEKIKACKGNITVLPHTKGQSVIDWFASIDFMISNTDIESWHAVITEGMLCGCIPLVRNWDGSEEIHPTGSIFENISQLVIRLKELVSQTQADRIRGSIQARKWCLERYGLADVSALYGDIIEGKEVPQTLNPKVIIKRRRRYENG